jgi:hypothetical protein
MAKTPNVPIHAPFLVNSYGFFDDFTEFSSASTTGRWTSTSTGGANAIQSSGSVAGGILGLVPSGGTPAANDAAYINGTNGVFQLVADCPIFFEAMIQYSEANTNNANVCAGLFSGTVTSALQSSSGGPSSNFYGALIYKQGHASGSPVWSTVSSLGTTQTLNTSKNASSVSNFVKLGVLIEPVVGGTAQSTAQTLTVSYFLNDQPLLQNVSAGSGFYPIKDTVSFTSPVTTYLYPVVGVKNGATVTGGMENVYIDYVQVWQKRAPNLSNPD